MPRKFPTVEEQNKAIREECDRFADFLVEKNLNYGGSVLSPVAILSKGDPLDFIFSRIDDKLSRILKGQDAGEDPWVDLRGYLVLWKVTEEFKKAGYYSGSAPVEDVELSNSALPMPIDSRCQTEDLLDLEAAEEEDDGPALDIPFEQDPIDMPVQDIEALAAQEISSICPNVPRQFEEHVDEDAGTTLAGESDPWAVISRPVVKPDAESLTPKLKDPSDW